MTALVDAVLDLAGISTEPYSVFLGPLEVGSESGCKGATTHHRRFIWLFLGHAMRHVVWLKLLLDLVAGTKSRRVLVQRKRIKNSLR
jgi:hypothetical protein